VTTGPSRRTFLRAGSAAAVGLAFPGRARRPLADARPRVGIVGGGLAGVACAWLLDGVADAVLFESGPALGGHAHTIAVAEGNQEIAVDVGAQFFASGTHPTYEKLLEVLGLLDPDRPDEYFTADIVIHRDPVYMPQNGRYWSAYNANTDGGHCEGSIWYGALRRVAEGGSPLSLFKSWATARSEAPRDEVFRRTFRHPLITPAFIEGQRGLAAYQGRADVWFAGSYTKEVDSQETALTSAMNVVAHLDPQAPNLLRLQA
jgi:predicted NAD/FAD-binding protein